MGKGERNREQILSMLRQRGRLSVSDVESELKLSAVTVRRYFSELEQSNQVIRTSGGICQPSLGAANEYRFSSRALSNLEEKHLIGIAAAAQIDSHDRLFFDSGTTVRECGNALVARIREQSVQEVSIVTNSLIYGEALPQACTLNLIGGTVRPYRMDLSGMAALSNIERFNFAKAFLGADGISATGELTTTDEETSLLAEAVVKHSAKVFILADSSKLGTKAFAPYGRLRGDKFTLITDAAADSALLDAYRANGINIIIAK